MSLKNSLTFVYSTNSLTRTSGMAEDVIVLLDFIGWSENKSIHVIGASLGGMIALGRIDLFRFSIH